MATFPADFYQVYGMTEASGAVTVLGPDAHRDHGERAPAGVGRAAVEGRGDRSRPTRTPVTPVAPGEVGEIMVRTEQLMAGYWGRPEETARAISRDGWLHSGDAGHIDADGYLYITDRIKDMIISGGENIYPAEIERVLGRASERRGRGRDRRAGREAGARCGKAIVVADAGRQRRPEPS